MNDNAKFNAINEELKERLFSGDAAMVKSAGLAASDYFRTKIRENGIRRKITPPETVTAENFDKDEESDIPSMLVNIVDDSAGAYQIPFETGPRGNVLHTRRARVEFNRIATYKYSIDKIRMTTWDVPLLDIFYDLMLKDIMDVEDRIWTAQDDAICGTVNTVNADMNCCRYITTGPIARESLAVLKAGMRCTPGKLQAKKLLMNENTYDKFIVMNRNTFGGDMAQTMLIEGNTMDKIVGVDVVVTTKDDLVADDVVYIYTDPKYYGGFYTYEDVTMVTDEKDGYWLSFFAYETIGGVIANAAGVAKASFTGTLKSWKTGL